MPEKLVIIGSGPAAWTCAIYAARANLNPVVYEGAITEQNRLLGTLPLGQLNLTTEVENFPGFPEGVLGPELIVRMRQQAERYGTKIVTDDIRSVDLSRRPFVLKILIGQSIKAHTIVISTGAAESLGLESESKYKNYGVSACTVAMARCRGFEISRSSSSAAATRRLKREIISPNSPAKFFSFIAAIRSRFESNG